MTSLKQDLAEFITSLLVSIPSGIEGGVTREIISTLSNIFVVAPSLSLTLLEKNSAKLCYSSDERSLYLTELQINARSGPLLEAAEKSESRQYDLDNFDEYSNAEFVYQVKEVAISSILAVPCRIGDGTVLVILYYFADMCKLSGEELYSIEIMTKTAAWSIWTMDKIAELTANAVQLEVALSSRDVIGQAKGILMAQNHITAEQAFGILRSKSQILNKKLRDVAEFVTMTGELPSKDSKWL
jgi:hypothetical protein